MKIEAGLIALEEEERYAHRFSSDGESIKEAIDRFMKFIQDVAPQYSGKTILVVNHGNIMRNFLIHIGWAKYEEMASGSVSNTGYFVLETDGKHIYNVKEANGVIKKPYHIENEE